MAVALGSALAQEKKEPSYDGKPLGEWLKLLRSPKVEERKKAVAVLVLNIGPEGKAAVPALIEALKDGDKDVRSFAAEALGGIGKEAGPAAPALVEALKDKEPGVRGSAAGALFALGPEAKGAVPALIVAFKDKDPGLRASAAWVLGGIGKQARPAIPVLIEALKDKEASVRARAAEALYEMGPEAKAAVPALTEALKDKDPATRAGSAGSLGSIGPEAKGAVPALIEALKDEEVDVRRIAARALGKIGPGAQAALPALKEALKEKTRDVRQAAAWALFAIDPEAAKRARVPEPATPYQAYIGTSAKGFERDDLPGDSYEIKGQGGEATHTLVLWVNGDPAGFFHTSDWKGVGLNPWLRPGKNELTFSGKNEKPVYVKVAKGRLDGFEGLAGKRRFSGPGGEGRAEPLVFQVERTPKLPEREELSERPEDRARYEKEVRALIVEVKELVRGGKGQEAARLLTVGPLLWAEAAEGFTPEEARKEFHDPTAKALSDPKVKAVDEGRPLRLLFGKRLVLAYVEPPAKEEYSRHLFVVERDRKQTLVGPFQLARVSGKWVFWLTEIAWE